MSASRNENNPNPRVAVLLAVFEGAIWLKEQMDSILSQVNVDITIFVSVDQSTDGSEQLIDRWASLDPRIQVLQHGFHLIRGHGVGYILVETNLSKHQKNRA